MLPLTVDTRPRMTVTKFLEIGNRDNFGCIAITLFKNDVSVTSQYVKVFEVAKPKIFSLTFCAKTHSIQSKKMIINFLI